MYFIQKTTNIMNEYQRLAESILLKNDLRSYQQMQFLLFDFKHVEAILCESEQNQTLLFVFCEILSKNILHEKFDAFDDAKSESGNSQQVLSTLRKYVYILQKTLKLYLAKQFDSRIGRSLKNLICVCIKRITEETRNADLFVSILKQFFPSFFYDHSIQSQGTGLVPIVQQVHSALPPHFFIGIEILRDVIDYLTISSHSKSYYVFRRNLYIFRNTFLPIILTIAIGYGKILLGEVKEPILIKGFVRFLYTIVTYPFSISTHDLNNEQSLGVTETYFPAYFRSFVCDEPFIQALSKLYLEIVRWEKQPQLMRQFTEILGRIISANQYLFNSDFERTNARIGGLKIAQLMLNSSNSLDFPYLVSFISIHKCILSIYIQSDFGSHQIAYICQLLNFLQHIISNAEIIIEQGRNNPITHAFSVITENILKHIGKDPFQEQINNILKIFFARIQDNNQMMRVWEQQPWSREQELEKFSQFFQPLVNILYLSQSIFLSVMQMLPINQLNQPAKIFWMYLTSYILPSSSASQRETQVIYKFFKEAQNYSSLACLQFLNQTLEDMLGEINNNEPSTSLWLNFQPLISMNFEAFLENIVGSSFNVLKQCQDQKILQGILKIFNTIYKKLRRSGMKSKQSFYTMIKNLLAHINETVFNRDKFYKIRIAFMEIVSIIWINFGEYEHIAEIYQLTVGKIKQNCSPLRFFQYLNDLTGFFDPIISPKCFQSLLELAIPDLKILSELFFKPEQCQELFKTQYALKSFLKFAYTTINGFHGKRFSSHPHSRLTIELYYLLYPILLEVLKFDYPQIVVQIWQEMMSLNPLGDLLPIHKDMNLKNPKQYIILLRLYSENLPRLKTPEALYSFYPFIKDNLEILNDWWMEVIQRELHPDINIKQIVDSNIWNRPREKTTLGQLLYTLGCYDPKYWPIQNQTKQEFVENFITRCPASDTFIPF